jgi:hypothetical protein
MCSQNQHCIILPWFHLWRIFVQQKLNISFVRVGCHDVGVLLNAIVKYLDAISSHVFWLHYSHTLMCSSSLGRWKLWATFHVILEMTFCPWRQSEICCSGKCRLVWQALKSFGNVLCAVPASFSAHILMCSWLVYGGGLISVFSDPYWYNFCMPWFL